jgi:myo-inositol-1(or 4)-monophosphatase
MLAAAEAAARLAGQILVQLQEQVQPREKGPADLVTDADLAAQQAIEERLAKDFPDFYFIGEESTASSATRDIGSGYGWIVDPLDGTTNYVHGLDNYCVSIALRHGPQIVLGVIFDPVREQLFSAIRGQGAWMNGRRLVVSRTERMDQALVVTSFAARVPPNSPEVTRFVRVLHRCRALRRLGSAALNLGYLAAGKVDAYWATSVKLWDVAAGLLCVEEAGGVVSSIDGSPLNLDDPQFLATATGVLHQQMLAALRLEG